MGKIVGAGENFETEKEDPRENWANQRVDGLERKTNRSY